MGRFLTEEEFTPFGDMLQAKLGAGYVVEFLSNEAGTKDPGFTLACKVTYKGNGHMKSVITGLAVTTMDDPSRERWARAAAMKIRKVFNLPSKWRN